MAALHLVRSTSFIVHSIEGVDDCNTSVYQGCNCCIFIVDPRNVRVLKDGNE